MSLKAASAWLSPTGLTVMRSIVRGGAARVLYDPDVGAEPPGRCHVEAWAPRVPGIREVFHAHMVDYAYPPHCHETWAVLIVDDGAIRYDLDRRRCGAAGQTVTILPPGVAHDGRPAPGISGFRKREIYLEGAFFPAELIGAAVDHTTISDPPLRSALSQLHDCLLQDAESLDAEARLALIGERITGHLTRTPRPAPPPEPGIAHRLRQLLEDHITGQVSLAWAAATLDRSIPHLVRSFTPPVRPEPVCLRDRPPHRRSSRPYAPGRPHLPRWPPPWASTTRHTSPATSRSTQPPHPPAYAVSAAKPQRAMVPPGDGATENDTLVSVPSLNCPS